MGTFVAKDYVQTDVRAKAVICCFRSPNIIKKKIDCLSAELSDLDENVILHSNLLVESDKIKRKVRYFRSMRRIHPQQSPVAAELKTSSIIQQSVNPYAVWPLKCLPLHMFTKYILLKKPKCLLLLRPINAAKVINTRSQIIARCDQTI